jgi:hypothetical protein
LAEGLQAWWKDWTQARWEKLNEAFGEGWEKECFPYLETGGWVGQAGHQHGISRDEAQWDAILEAVKLFKQTHGRFPRSSGGDADETRLYNWLQRTTWTPPPNWTPRSAPTSSSWPSATAGSPSASPSPSGHGNHNNRHIALCITQRVKHDIELSSGKQTQTPARAILGSSDRIVAVRYLNC